MYWDKKCPFCNEYVHYWPNCTASTNPDYDNYGWIYQGKGQWKIKRFFHLSCLRENSRKNKKKNN